MTLQGRRGLANIGNTCGLNALLQSIVRLRSLVNHLITNPTSDPTHPLTTELTRLIQEFWIQDQSLAPKRFAHAFHEAIQGRLVMGDQLDMSEMWMVMLDRLEREIVDGNALKTTTVPWTLHPSAGPPSPYKNMSVQAVQAWDSLAAKMPVEWANLVNGIQVNQVVCSNPACKHVYHNFEPFSMLTLDIPSASQSTTVHLSDCLRAYMLPETMSEWKCDKCHEKGSQKLVRFWCAPTILVIALKRFNGLGQKVNTPVTLPDIFELTAGSELCQNIGPKTPPYKLKAIGCHFGSLGGGHYTALGRDAGGSWLHLDDLNITVLPDSSQVLKNNPHAYLLFYER